MEGILYFEKFLKPFCALALILGLSFSASAADYNLRMTMNSNDQDEDYDGSIVFKNYVESASNGAVSVELFVGTQLCSKGAECLQGARYRLGGYRALLSKNKQAQTRADFPA